MSIRKIQEEIQNTKEQDGAAAEASLQAEKAQEVAQKEASFQAAFVKRNTLQEALGDLQGSKGNLQEARQKQKKELRNIVSLVDEIKKKIQK